MSQSKKKQTPKEKKNENKKKNSSKYLTKVKIDPTFEELIDMAAKGYGAKKKEK